MPSPSMSRPPVVSITCPAPQRRSASVQREISYENLTGQSQRSLAIGWGDALPKPNNAATAAPVPVAPPKAGNLATAWSTFGNTVVAALGALQPLLWLLPLFVVAAALKTVAFKGWIGEELVRHLLKKRLHAPSEVSRHTMSPSKMSAAAHRLTEFLSPNTEFLCWKSKITAAGLREELPTAIGGKRTTARQYEFQTPLRQNYRHTQALERLPGLAQPGVSFGHCVCRGLRAEVRFSSTTSAPRRI